MVLLSHSYNKWHFKVLTLICSLSFWICLHISAYLSLSLFHTHTNKHTRTHTLIYILLFYSLLLFLAFLVFLYHLPFSLSLSLSLSYTHTHTHINLSALLYLFIVGYLFFSPPLSLSVFFALYIPLSWGILYSLFIRFSVSVSLSLSLSPFVLFSFIYSSKLLFLSLYFPISQSLIHLLNVLPPSLTPPHSFILSLSL